jgi:phage terminase Nu1 subunit (DNA packaging protein)
MATQTEVAKHLFISDRQVRNLITDGVFAGTKGKGGLDIDDCRKRYIGYLRSIKTGQTNPDSESGSDTAPGDIVGGINIPLQDARKKKADADIREHRLAVMRQEYAPVMLLSDAVIRLSEMMVAQLQALPMKLKVADPSMTARSVDAAKKQIADLCNGLADIELDLSDYTPVDPDGSQEGAEPAQDI